MSRQRRLSASEDRVVGPDPDVVKAFEAVARAAVFAMGGDNHCELTPHGFLSDALYAIKRDFEALALLEDESDRRCFAWRLERRVDLARAIGELLTVLAERELTLPLHGVPESSNDESEVAE